MWERDQQRIFLQETGSKLEKNFYSQIVINTVKSIKTSTKKAQHNFPYADEFNEEKAGFRNLENMDIFWFIELSGHYSIKYLSEITSYICLVLWNMHLENTWNLVCTFRSTFK